MSSYTRGQQLAAALTPVLAGFGVPVVTTPRNLVPPAALIGPPDMTGDVYGGFTAVWSVLLVLPGGLWDSDNWRLADDVVTALEPHLSIESVSFTTDPDTSRAVARITFQECV